MAKENITIFYPLGSQNNGYVYGWNVSRRVLCVAGIIACDSHDRAQNILQQASQTYQWKDIASPEMQPRILGRGSSANGPTIVVDKESDDVICFIFYRRQDRGLMRFYTIEPLELDVTTTETTQRIDQLSLNMRILSRLDFTKRPPKQALSHPSIPVDHMNIAYELDYIIQRVTVGQNIARLGATSRQKLTSLIRSLLTLHVVTRVTVVYRALVSALCGLCELPVPAFPFRGNRLKDLSASFQQLDVRLEQAMFLPIQSRVLGGQNHRKATYFAAHYISFYNCIWLVLNDAIVGAAFGTFLFENSDFLGRLLYLYTRWFTVLFIRSALVWLDHWPAGLKLNTELSRFLSLCFMSLTDLWGIGLELSAPHFPVMLRVIGIMGRSGMTMILSLISDLLSLLTGHLYLSYLIATMVFSQQLTMVRSLWNLFRGKRHNVLRNRTDSWDYDIDQLLLGTILFTLVAFLFPTVLVYYALFAMARLVILLMHAILETLLAFMNHFPLFAMMLRVKDPSRLPGGMYFVPSNMRSGAMVVKNLPISFSRIFFQHLLVWSRLSAHYHPLRLLRCLITGTPLTQISRYSIRYSMIPGLPENVYAEHE